LLERLKARLTYANVMATLAAFGVLAGGTAWALQNNSVRSKHIKDNAVDFRDLKGVKAWNKRVPVTGSDPDAGVARAEASKVALAKRGTIRLYGKCFRNETNGFLSAGVYAKTSANGALFRGGTSAPQRLNTTTDEAIRAIGSAAAPANGVDFANKEFDSTVIIAAGHKLALNVISHPAAKQGTPAIGKAPFGAGARCSFSGFVVG
jgi:hypothetical protein